MNFKNNRWLIFILYILVVYTAIVVIVNSYSVHLGSEGGNTQVVTTSRPEKTPEPTPTPSPEPVQEEYEVPKKTPGRVRYGDPTIAKLFNVDYATFVKEFGKPVDVMYYHGSAVYRFEDEGPWFYFYGKDHRTHNEDGTMMEPEPGAICTIIYASVKKWLNTTLTISSIDDVKAIGPVSEYERNYSEYDGTYVYYGETDWYDVHIYEYNGMVTGECSVELWLKD